MSDDIHLLSLVELADAIAARQLSAVEVMTATVTRAERLQPVLNCFISLQAEAALESAAVQPMARSHGARHRARCTACPSPTRTCSTERATSPPAARASARTSCPTTTAPPSPAFTGPARSTSAGSTWRSSLPARPATTSIGATAATPGTKTTSPAARRAARAPRSPAAWCSAPSAPTRGARCGCRRPATAWWGSRRLLAWSAGTGSCPSPTRWTRWGRSRAPCATRHGSSA